MKKEEQIEMAQQSWVNFTKATTWSVLGVVAVLLLMALFLV